MKFYPRETPDCSFLPPDGRNPYSKPELSIYSSSFSYLRLDQTSLVTVNFVPDGTAKAAQKFCRMIIVCFAPYAFLVLAVLEKLGVLKVDLMKILCGG